MSEVKYFRASARGSHVNNAGEPRWEDTKLVVAEMARGNLIKALVNRPGIAYINYDGREKTVTDHGKFYEYNGEEDIVFTAPDPDTDGRRGKWRGTITASITSGFNVSTE